MVQVVTGTFSTRSSATMVQVWTGTWRVIVSVTYVVSEMLRTTGRETKLVWQTLRGGHWMATVAKAFFLCRQPKSFFLGRSQLSQGSTGMRTCRSITGPGTVTICRS